MNTRTRQLNLALIAALLAAIFSFAAAGSARADDDIPPPPEPPADPPDRRFGAVETYHTPELADEANVGWTRIIFYWSELKKDGPGEWNWFHAPIYRIDREITGGREVVGVIKHTPAFATDGMAGAGVPRGLYLPVDDPENLWAVFVRELVEAYRGRVDRWVIWNEPDIDLETFGADWQGTTADYVQLVRVAYLAAHEVNPDVKIHLGGLTYWHNPGYLSEFLALVSEDPAAAENGYYFDVVSTHIYFKPESTLDIVGSLRETLAEYGLEDKPIWINETNAPPYDDPAQPWDDPGFPVTQEMQASYLVQEFSLALAAGVERIAVYKWIDEPEPQPGFEPYGLLRYDRSPRPAYDAFCMMTTHFADTDGALHIPRDDFQQVILSRRDQTTRVFWARSAAGPVIDVPALSGSALLVDQTGAETTIYPHGGVYTLDLPGASCDPELGCFMGGEPRVLVEAAQADLADWPALAASVQSVLPADGSFTVNTTRTQSLFGAQPGRSIRPLVVLSISLGLLIVSLGACRFLCPRD